MAETRGIEVFGRGATVVDTSVEVARRGPWLGVLSVLLGLLAAVGTAIGVISVAGDQAEFARWVAYAAIGCSILGAAAGFVAVVAGRGVTVGLWGMALSVVGNPWVLTRLLDGVGALASAAS